MSQGGKINFNFSSKTTLHVEAQRTATTPAIRQRTFSWHTIITLTLHTLANATTCQSPTKNEYDFNTIIDRTFINIADLMFARIYRKQNPNKPALTLEEVSRKFRAATFEGMKTTMTKRLRMSKAFLEAIFLKETKIR